MIEILRPTQRAGLVSARVFDAQFSRNLGPEVVVRQVALLPWLDSLFGPRAAPFLLNDAARHFAELTRGFDFLCPDHHAIPLVPIFLTLRNRLRSPVRLLLVAHAPGAYGLEWVLLRPLLVPGDLIIAPSGSAKEVIEFLYPDLGPYTHVIPHPISPLPDLVSDGSPRIVSLSRLHRTKLIHRQIEAMAIVSRRGAGVPSMQLAGPLHEADSARVSPYVRSLAAKIHRLGLEEHVQFVGEVEGDTSKASFLSGAHMLLNLSVSIEESFGKAAVEALGVGVPVLASRWNGLPETVGDGGEFVGVKYAGSGVDVDPEDIADAIERLISAPPSVETCREQAQRSHPQRISRLYRSALENALAMAHDHRDAVGSMGDDGRGGAPEGGLLSLTAPLPEFSWQELFELHVEDARRIHRTIAGEKLPDVSNGERLRSVIILGVRAPLERFLAGLDFSRLAAATGTAGGRQLNGEDFLSRLGAAAANGGTRSSRLACLDVISAADQTELLREGLQGMRRDGLCAPGIDYLEVELARQDRLYARAFRLCTESEHAESWGEPAAPRLRQLARVCREWGVPGLALPWLRDWLTAFPDSPDSGLIWLDRSANAIQASSDLIREAAESYAWARNLLSVDPHVNFGEPSKEVAVTGGTFSPDSALPA
jgi:glycosyltransferase involved in cell wall biosynthesis